MDAELRSVRIERGVASGGGGGDGEGGGAPPRRHGWSE